LIAVVYSQVGGEEAMLAVQFGDEYLEYKKRTPRFIPRII